MDHHALPLRRESVVFVDALFPSPDLRIQCAVTGDTEPSSFSASTDARALSRIFGGCADEHAGFTGVGDRPNDDQVSFIQRFGASLNRHVHSYYRIINGMFDPAAAILEQVRIRVLVNSMFGLPD